jgi:hypothetical protein
MSIRHSLPDTVSSSQPHTVRKRDYFPRMPENIKTVLRDNLQAVLRERYPTMRPNESGITKLVELGVAQGSAQRAIGGETSIGIDMLEKIASAIGLQTWQLLVPELNARAPQSLSADPRAWPFEMVDRTKYFALGEKDRLYAQGALGAAVSERSKSSVDSTTQRARSAAWEDAQKEARAVAAKKTVKKESQPSKPAPTQERPRTKSR